MLQTVRDPIHQPVLVFGMGPGVLGLAVGVWCNYFYGTVFSSTVIAVTTPLAGAGLPAVPHVRSRLLAAADRPRRSTASCSWP